MQTAQVIPFRFDAQEVRTLLIEDQPWFVAVDVCASLGLNDTNKALVGLDEDEKREHEQYSGSGRKPILINESGLYSLILRSRKAEAKRFKKWVTAEVLPAIRKHGQYHDTDNRMATIAGAALGMTELGALKGLIHEKARLVPKARRVSFMHSMHNRLHTRFNVPRTELIPVAEFADACNFVAAYALEGEWLPKQDGLLLEPRPNRRYLVSFNRKGEQHVAIVPADASVMSHRQLIAAMLKPGEIGVSTDEMFEFVSAGMQNLKMRADNQANMLRTLSPAR